MVTIKPKNVVDTIHSYPLGDSPEEIKRKYNLQKVRKMSDNENVYGCSIHVQKAIFRKVNNLHLYPNGRAEAVINKLSSFYKLKADNIFIGNGSEEIIRLLTRAYLNAGEEALMADMTFPRYETNVSIEGGKSIAVPLIEGVHDLTGMYGKITKKTKMVFICNPNNPTGTIVSMKDLVEFIEKVPPYVLIILDEAYYEYVSSADYLQTTPLLEKYSNLIILRTFSKIYGLAGLRIGYGMMAAPIVKELQKVKEVFNVNTLAQEAAVVALDDQEFVTECALKNEIERKYVCSYLHELRLKFFPSETNFIFICSHVPVVQKLTEKGILVRQMKMTGFSDAFRITLGMREDNEQFLTILKDLLSERAV